jgi:hypothetical protein
MTLSLGSMQNLLAIAAFASLGQANLSCTKDTFGSVSLQHTEVLSIKTSLSNITALPGSASSQPTNFWPTSTVPITPVCQVTVQYTHSGWKDTVNIYVWLPMSEWNGRLVGIGGGGWATGSTDDLALPVTMGYATVTTDGGHTQSSSDVSPEWVVAGDGNMNWYAFQSFAAVALDDAATLGKGAAAALYGGAPKYSYWSVRIPLFISLKKPIFLLDNQSPSESLETVYAHYPLVLAVGNLKNSPILSSRAVQQADARAI